MKFDKAAFREIAKTKGKAEAITEFHKYMERYRKSIWPSTTVWAEDGIKNWDDYLKMQEFSRELWET